MASRRWIVWVPGEIAIADRLAEAGLDCVARIGGDIHRGRLYVPAQTIARVTREQAEAAAAEKYGPGMIVTRKRGSTPTHAFATDLRPRPGDPGASSLSGGMGMESESCEIMQRRSPPPPARPTPKGENDEQLKLASEKLAEARKNQDWDEVEFWGNKVAFLSHVPVDR